MRLVSWNINGLRARLPRCMGFLERHAPDVLCLQETKVPDAMFPHLAFMGEGYAVQANNQADRNGVAILSRQAADEVRRSFPGDPCPEQRRSIWCRFGDLWVGNVYVVNGRSVEHADFDLKRRWLTALGDHLANAFEAQDRVIVVGDWNVAPEDRDVHDPDAWRGHNLCTSQERAWLAHVQESLGLVDLHRRFEEGPGPWTWWDYRMLAFPRDHGLRIDLALATAPVAQEARAVWVDREERKQGPWEEKPSDHAPLVVDLAS